MAGREKVSLLSSGRAGRKIQGTAGQTASPQFLGKEMEKILLEKS